MYCSIHYAPFDCCVRRHGKGITDNEAKAELSSNHWWWLFLVPSSTGSGDGWGGCLTWERAALPKSFGTGHWKRCTFAVAGFMSYRWRKWKWIKFCVFYSFCRKSIASMFRNAFWINRSSLQIVKHHTSFSQFT